MATLPASRPSATAAPGPGGHLVGKQVERPHLHELDREAVGIPSDAAFDAAREGRAARVLDHDALRAQLGDGRVEVADVEAQVRVSDLRGAPPGARRFGGWI